MKNGVKIALIASIAIVLAVGSFFAWRAFSNKQNESAFAWPVKVEDGKKINIEQVYGLRSHPILNTENFHEGIDIQAQKGDKVYASQDGIVELAEWNGGYGNCVIVKHDDGFKTLYAHLDMIGVEKDKKVNKGDIVGVAGNTGLATADHLHFEIIKDDKNIDPETILPKLANIDHIQPKPASVPEYVWPYDNKKYSKVDMTPGFGTRINPVTNFSEFHTGVDIAIPINTTIFAIKSGTVTKAEWYGGYGLFVEIYHGDGIKSRYGHLSKLQVKKGDMVDIYQVIGFCGNTGYSTGPHLHFEIMKDNDFIDPMEFLRSKIK
jgi:murein DD-endopeptidase MepM/ murein hydrolase activator NlpD